LVILGLLLGIALTAGVFWNRIWPVGAPPNTASPNTGAGNSPAPHHAPALLETAFGAAGAIYRADFDALAALSSAEGVLFAPSATVDKDLNLSFTPDEIRKFPAAATEEIWGMSAETGEPILLTPAQYFEQYLREEDYAKAPMIGVNTIVKAGQQLENTADMFPEASFVDLHFPGTDSASGAGWHTLRLVFSPQEDSLKLIAVIRSAWG
jgi:hypothetical protein